MGEGNEYTAYVNSSSNESLYCTLGCKEESAVDDVSALDGFK